METLRKNIKYDTLNNKKLTDLLKKAGLPNTSYRVLVFDINNKLLGAVKRTGKLLLFSEKEKQQVIKLLNEEAKWKEIII